MTLPSCFLTSDNSLRSHSFSSSNLIEMVPTLQTAKFLENSPSSDTYNAEFALLDLYCGCGGMSTGLCLGAKLSSVNLVTVVYELKFQFVFLCISY